MYLYSNGRERFFLEVRREDDYFCHVLVTNESATRSITRTTTISSMTISYLNVTWIMGPEKDKYVCGVW